MSRSNRWWLWRIRWGGRNLRSSGKHYPIHKLANPFVDRIGSDPIWKRAQQERKLIRIRNSADSKVPFFSDPTPSSLVPLLIFLPPEIFIHPWMYFYLCNYQPLKLNFWITPFWRLSCPWNEEFAINLFVMGT